MMRSLLKQSWLAQVRAPLFQRTVIVNVLLVFLILYLVGSLAFAGYFFGELLKAVAPEAPPLETFSQLIFYSWGAVLLIRFLGQNFPIMDIRHYLLLPIRRGQLFHHLLLRSVFHAFNLMALAFVLPFTLRTVLPAQGGLAALAWLLSLLSISLFNHFLSFYLKRQFNLSPPKVIAGLVLIAGLTALDAQGLLPLSESLGKGMMALSDAPLGALAFMALVPLSYFLIYSALNRNAYLDTLQARQAAVKSGQDLALLKGLGAAGQLLQLSLRLIWRNKRPKGLLLMAALFLFYPFFGLRYLQEAETGLSLVFLTCLLSTVFPMSSYGQFLFAWESSFFSLLMARKVTVGDYLKSKYWLLVLLNTLACLIGLLYGLADWRMMPMMLTAFFVNTGIGIYIILWLAPYSTKSIDLESSPMNWDVLSGPQYLMSLLVMIIPVGLYFVLQLLLDWPGALAVLALFGLIGMALHRPLMRSLERHLAKRKHSLYQYYQSNTP